MNVTKLSIFAEIDGVVCHIPSSQFHSINLAISSLQSASKHETLHAIKLEGYKISTISEIYYSDPLTKEDLNEALPIGDK